MEPTSAELTIKLDLDTRTSKPSYDVIIVGGGPAGLTAAIYTGREGLDTLVIEPAGLGGQAAISQMIDNYPGFEEGITGEAFAERLSSQACRLGVEVIRGEEVTDIDGALYRDKEVLIVGGGNSAYEESLLLAHFASRVAVAVRGPAPRARSRSGIPTAFSCLSDLESKLKIRSAPRAAA